MNECVEKLAEGVQMIQDGMAKLNVGPLSYTLEVLLVSHKLLTEKYAPFRVGQTVILVKTPDFKVAFGWSGREHWMKAGAIGIVESIAVDSRGYLSYGLTFKAETWIDQEKKERPVDRLGVYCFREDDLRLL